MKAAVYNFFLKLMQTIPTNSYFSSEKLVLDKAVIVVKRFKPIMFEKINTEIQLLKMGRV
jgi:hypothetical protein